MNTVQIQSTKDYDLFKTIGGNRLINQNYVANLTKAIMHKNLLSANPIIVNNHFEVIDGQHRLEVARNNNLEIYYVVVDNTDINDVQALNVYMRRWTGLDYLQSYISQGKENYKTIQEFMDRYELPVSTAVEILAGPQYGGGKWASFKRGEFEIPSMEESVVVADAVVKIKPYCGPRVWRDMDFIRALRRAMQTATVDALIEKLEASGRLIEAQVDTRSYMRQFEDIINWKSRGDFLRLY